MLKGYIEGYYGRLFSQDERAKVINHMGKLKMDFYLYGPKEDLYHRIEWGKTCLLYTSPSPRDVEESRMPSCA